MTTNDEETWLGPLSRVHEKLREENDSDLLYSMRDEWVETPVSDEHIAALAQKLLSMEERLRPAYLEWWEGGRLDETLTVGGYSIRRIMDMLGTSPSYAFTWLIALTRNAEQARKNLYYTSRNPSSIVRARPLS